MSAAQQIEAITRALDDEEANLADDGARLSHSVVRRVRAILAAPSAQGSSAPTSQNPEGSSAVGVPDPDPRDRDAWHLAHGTHHSQAPVGVQPAEDRRAMWAKRLYPAFEPAEILAAPESVRLIDIAIDLSGSLVAAAVQALREEIAEDIAGLMTLDDDPMWGYRTTADMRAAAIRAVWDAEPAAVRDAPAKTTPNKEDQ